MSTLIPCLSATLIVEVKGMWGNTCESNIEQKGMRGQRCNALKYPISSFTIDFIQRTWTCKANIMKLCLLWYFQLCTSKKVSHVNVIRPMKREDDFERIVHQALLSLSYRSLICPPICSSSWSGDGTRWFQKTTDKELYCCCIVKISFVYPPC